MHGKTQVRPQCLGPGHSTTRLDVAKVDALRSCSVSGTNRYQMLDTRGRRTREYEDRGQHRSAEHGEAQTYQKDANKLATVHAGR